MRSTDYDKKKRDKKEKPMKLKAFIWARDIAKPTPTRCDWSDQAPFWGGGTHFFRFLQARSWVHVDDGEESRQNGIAWSKLTVMTTRTLSHDRVFMSHPGYSAILFNWNLVDGPQREDESIWMPLRLTFIISYFLVNVESYVTAQVEIIDQK